MYREKPAEGHIPAFSVPILAAIVTLAAAANWYAFSSEVAISPCPPDNVSELIPPQMQGGPRVEANAGAPAAYAATLARPLFRTSRRPVEAKDTGPAVAATGAARQAAPSLPEQIQLAGIVRERGKPGRALIRSAESPAGAWVEVGHQLDGWRLSEIEAQSIVFEAGGLRHTLSLFPARTQ